MSSPFDTSNARHVWIRNVNGRTVVEPSANMSNAARQFWFRYRDRQNYYVDRRESARKIQRWARRRMFRRKHVFNKMCDMCDDAMVNYWDFNHSIINSYKAGRLTSDQIFKYRDLIADYEKSLWTS